MHYVPDTSVIVDGRFTSFISRKKDAKVILAESLVAEIEHQANQGRSIGFAAIQELKALREMSESGKIELEFYGERPTRWQISSAHMGEIDEIIRKTAAENDAILVTGDNIQRDIAMIKGISVQFLEHPESKLRNIEDFFGELTSSVHLKVGMKPLLKEGKPGEVRMRQIDEIISAKDLDDIASNIVKRGRLEDESFVEMDMHGATVIQLRNMRIVITRPPFSDDLEITAVRPIAKLSISDYNLDEKLMERLSSGLHGILVAGAPGAGKSTFVQAVAEFLASQGSIVKTMEKPRDLQLSKEITQYTGLEGSMERTGDILLLVRTDYTIFDEMRITSDFLVYSDLRLAGVGMVGVVHATKPVDALQRFIGRVELGLIPQIIDTVIFIDRGMVSSVLVTRYSVKVPSGMNQEDLARPVIEVMDFFTEKTLYEIYSFGEQIVVVPVMSQNPAVTRIAEQKIREEIAKYAGDRVDVRMTGNSRAVVMIPEESIPRVIGRRGSNISEIERNLGVRIEIEPLVNKINTRNRAEIEIKNKIIYIYTGSPNRNVKLYIDGILVLQARSSSKGIVRIRASSDTGSELFNAIKAGKNVEYLVGE
ncbi:MAG: PINc/VapC family ATPase [Candidatus Thermoplasmatota archaeon]|nr:PINc/VapC family ATPase [Candidatus Thermoplasmatota archaeon]